MEKTLQIQIDEAYNRGWNDAISDVGYDIRQLLDSALDDNTQIAQG